MDTIQSVTERVKTRQMHFVLLNIQKNFLLNPEYENLKG